MLPGHKQRRSLLAAFAHGAAAYACARAHAKDTVDPPKPGHGVQLWVVTAAMEAMPEMPWRSNGSVWQVQLQAPSSQHAHSDAPPPVATAQGHRTISCMRDIKEVHTTISCGRVGSRSQLGNSPHALMR